MPRIGSVTPCQEGQGSAAIAQWYRPEVELTTEGPAAERYVSLALTLVE